MIALRPRAVAADASPARPGSRRAWALRALAALALLCPAAPALGASSGPSLSLTATATEIRPGTPIGLTGALLDAGGAPRGGAPVELQVDPYPYRGFFDASHTSTAADGTFSFGPLMVDRNTRYRVRAESELSRATIVYVDSPAVLQSYDRGPGRTMLTMLSYHSGYFRWIGVRAYWYVAPAGSDAFRLAAVTRTRELRPGVTFASATIDPPSPGFAFRVCFNGAGEAGAGPPAAHARCPRGDFRVRRGPRR